MRGATFVFLLFTGLFLSASMVNAAEPLDKFAVYYSDQAAIKDFDPYNIVVLDQHHHPHLQSLREHGKILLGYISLGEVKKTDSYFDSLKQHDIVLDENPNWKGSYYLDIRNPFWTKTVIENIIPAILGAGFNGIFIDTLDSPLYMETQNPKKYPGMADSAVHLIEAIKMHYPDTPVMVNRAYTILPRIGGVIDMELGESVYSDYDFGKKKYGRVDEATHNQQLKWLHDAQQQNAKLKIYTLDYADPKDERGINKIYKAERENGFVPYVATVDLDRLVDEPQHR